MTNETNDQVTRDAAAILAELMDAVDALAESWRGEADTYRDRRQFAAADAIGTAALQASDTVAALRTRVAAGQTRQAPRESTIVPVNDSGELECTCGSNQIQELGQIAPGGLWWYHVGQNAATRVLRVGGWDWEGADGTGFECRDCHAEYDVLPEGWDVDYV